MLTDSLVKRYRPSLTMFVSEVGKHHAMVRVEII